MPEVKVAVHRLETKLAEVQDAIRDLNTRLVDVEHFLARLALPAVPSPPTLPEYFPRSSRWILEIFPDEVSAWREALAKIPREPLTAKERSFLRSMDYYITSERRVTLPQLAWLSAIIRRVGDRLPEVPLMLRAGSSPQSHHSPAKRCEHGYSTELCPFCKPRKEGVVRTP